MVRPLKFYILFNYGVAYSIVEGMKNLKPGQRGWSYKTREAAEVAYCWHNYNHWKRQQPAANPTGYCDRYVMCLF